MYGGKENQIFLVSLLGKNYREKGEKTAQKNAPRTQN